MLRADTVILFIFAILFLPVCSANAYEYQSSTILYTGFSRHTDDDLLSAKDGGFGFSLSGAGLQSMDDGHYICLHAAYNRWTFQNDYDDTKNPGHLSSISSLEVVPCWRYNPYLKSRKIYLFAQLGAGVDLSIIKKQYKYYSHVEPVFLPSFGIQLPASKHTLLELTWMYHIYSIRKEKDYDHFNFWNIGIGLVIIWDKE